MIQYVNSAFSCQVLSFCSTGTQAQRRTLLVWYASRRFGYQRSYMNRLNPRQCQRLVLAFLAGGRLMSFCLP